MTFLSLPNTAVAAARGRAGLAKMVADRGSSRYEDNSNRTGNRTGRLQPGLAADGAN
jgi:hypothetical protein